MKNQTLHQYLNAAKIGIPKGLPDLPMAFVPKPHQVSGLNQCLSNDRYGLFDQQGTGKTVIMQAYSIVHRWNGYGTMVIMPPILLEQYEEALFDTFYGLDRYLYVHQLEEGPSARHELYAKWDADGWPDFMLMSYQMFNKSEIQEKVCPMYNIFVADEAQFLRGHESNTHGRLYELTDDDKEAALLLATGTPIHNTPLDAYGIVRLLNRRAYSSHRNFHKLHCVTESTFIRRAKPVHGRLWQKVSKVVAYTNRAYLKENLYKNARRVLRKDVLPIGEPTAIEIPIKLHKKHLRLYRQFTSNRILEISNGDIIEATSAQALRQELLRMISSPHTYSETVPVSHNRIYETIRMLFNNDPEEKMTLFANMHQSIEGLAEHFAGYKPALAYGGMGGSKQNREQVDRFLNDDECRMLIANPKSAGAGLNLQSVCHRAVFVEPVTIPGDFKQAADRFTREGQKYPVLIYILKPLDTLAEFMTATMQEREGYFLDLNPDVSSFIMEAQGKSIAEVRRTA